MFKGFHHEGNRRFRELIDDHLENYIAAKSKINRSIIVSKIVEHVRSQAVVKGGFVRQDPVTKRWFEVEDRIAREKVGKAIRAALKRRGAGIAAPKPAAKKTEVSGCAKRKRCEMNSSNSNAVEEALQLSRRLPQSRIDRAKETMLTLQYMNSFNRRFTLIDCDDNKAASAQHQHNSREMMLPSFDTVNVQKPFISEPLPFHPMYEGGDVACVFQNNVPYSNMALSVARPEKYSPICLTPEVTMHAGEESANMSNTLSRGTPVSVHDDPAVNWENGLSDLGTFGSNESASTRLVAEANQPNTVDTFHDLYHQRHAVSGFKNVTQTRVGPSTTKSIEGGDNGSSWRSFALSMLDMPPSDIDFL